jgi:hypothetical protein
VGGTVAHVAEDDQGRGDDWMEADWRIDAEWTDSTTTGHLSISGFLSDRAPATDKTVQRDGYRANAGVGGHVGGWDLSSSAFAGYAKEMTESAIHDALATGVSARADWAERGLSFSAAYENRTLDHSEAGWGVDAMAAVDMIKLFAGDQPGLAGVSALGTVEADVDNQASTFADIRAALKAQIDF